MQKQNNGQLRPADIVAGKALAGLSKNFIMIGRRNVIAWKAWLVIGLVAGISLGVMIVANRSGKVDIGRAEIGKNVPGKSVPVDQILSVRNLRGALSMVPTVALSSKTPTNLSPSVPGGRSISLGTVSDTAFSHNLPSTIANASLLQKANGYIVKLSRLSLAEKYESLNKEIYEVEGALKEAASTSARVSLQSRIENFKKERRSKLLSHLALLASEQEQAGNSIRAIAPSATVKTRFSRSFNGVYLESTEEEAKRLKDAGFTLFQNQVLRAVLMDSVPLIGADRVWQMQDEQGSDITGKGMKIAIFDSGVDYTHRDLGGCLGPGCKVAGGYDFVNNDSDPMDDRGHGTHVAATAAGNGALKGVAPDANIYAYKVLDKNGYGHWGGVIEGIDYALDPNKDGDFSDRPDVINMSLGGIGDPDDPISQAVDNAVRIGSVVAVAAGNNNRDVTTIMSPGVARNAITVGATTKSDGMAWFSLRGPVLWNDQSIVKPDIAAPGEFICAAEWDGWQEKSRCLDNEHISISGTSMATPHVAGAIALIRQAHPDWTPAEVKASLKNNATNIGFSVLDRGSGRLDVPAAVSLGQLPPPIATLDPISTSGITRQIRGTIVTQSLKEWSIAYAPYTPSSPEISWQYLIRSSALPSTQDLYTLDLTPILGGKYIVRLLVEDSSGKQGVDYGYFLVDNWSIAAPLEWDIYRGGDIVPLQVALFPGFTIQSILWEYAIDAPELSWMPIGANADEDWNTSGLFSGWYKIRATIAEEDLSSQETVRVYLDTTLKQGWPVRISWEPDTYPFCNPFPCLIWGGYVAPAVSDLDNDGYEEIVVFTGGNPPKLRVFRNDGTVLWMQPVGTKMVVGGNLHIPLIADIDNDGKKEVFAYNYNEYKDEDEAEFAGFKADGKSLEGWPIRVPRDLHLTMMAADIDRDGNKEIVLKGNYAPYTYSTSVPILVIAGNGSILSKWSLPNPYLPTSLSGSPAVGNFDDDKDLEVVIAFPVGELTFDPETNSYLHSNTGKMHVFNLDGSEVSGWPVIFPGTPFSSPAIGDLNDDGKNEIVVGLVYTSPLFPDPQFGGLYVFDAKGNIMPGWPVMKGYNYSSSPSLADLNGDGDLEIVASQLGFVTEVYDHTGMLVAGWPQYTTWNDYYSTIAGDVDGDRIPDILTTAGSWPTGNGGVYGWKADGSVLAGFPKATEVDAQAPAVISDIDGDGKTDIIASSDLDFDGINYKNRSSIYVWETLSEFDKTAAMPWPTFHHDVERTGLYEPPLTEGALSVGMDIPMIPAHYMAVGKTRKQGVDFTKFRFHAQGESVSLDMVRVTLEKSDDGRNEMPNFSALYLYNGTTTKVGGPFSLADFPLASNATSSYPITLFMSGVIVPQDGDIVLTLKADLNGTTNGAQSTTTPRFYIANVAEDVLSLGVVSGSALKATLMSDFPNPELASALPEMTIVRSQPIFALCTVSNCSKASPSGSLVPGITEVVRFRITADGNDVIFDGTNHNLRFAITQSGGSAAGRKAMLYETSTSTPLQTISNINLSTATSTLNFNRVRTTILKGSHKEYYVTVDLTDYSSAGEIFLLSLRNTAAALSWSDGVTADIAKTGITRGLPMKGGTLTR